MSYNVVRKSISFQNNFIKQGHLVGTDILMNLHYSIQGTYFYLPDILKENCMQ